MRVLGGGAAVLRAAMILMVLAVASMAPAQADGRVALVIGNADYGAAIGPLKNPANDAKLIADTLESLGFKVDLVLNADQRTMKRAVKSFGAKLLASGSDAIGLFYYAGHGVQVDGENYLIPVGAEIAGEGDVSIEAISASDVLAQMRYAGNAINLVFLDACRNNPLTRSFRSSERGLARLDAPRGSFVGYSTAPGEVAEDGPGANSPYALALAAELQKPGESVDTAHRNVRSKVLAATGKRQTPWDSSSLTGEVILASLTPEVPAPAAAADKAEAQPTQQAELLFWESIKDSTNPAMFQAYLKRYPNGEFVELAEAKLAELQPTETAALTPEAAPSTVAEAPLEIEEMDATYVALQSANLRAAPSTDAKVLSKLKSDEIVSVTGKVKGKDWLHVKYGDATGYVSAKLLQQADAAEVAAWQKLKPAPTVEAVQQFLEMYPGGTFEPRAKALLANLKPPSEPKVASGDATLPAGSSSSGARSEPIQVETIISTEKLLRDADVRKEPGSGSIIGQLKQDALVTATGRVKDLPWVRILFGGQEKIGYLEADALVAATVPMKTELFAATQPSAPAQPPAAPADQSKSPTEEFRVGQVYIYHGYYPSRGIVTVTVEAQTHSDKFSAIGELASSDGNYQVGLDFHWEGDRLIVKGTPMNGGTCCYMRFSLTKAGPGKYSGRDNGDSEVTLTLKGL